MTLGGMALSQEESGQLTCSSGSRMRARQFIMLGHWEGEGGVFFFDERIEQVDCA